MPVSEVRIKYPHMHPDVVLCCEKCGRALVKKVGGSLQLLMKDRQIQIAMKDGATVVSSDCPLCGKRFTLKADNYLTPCIDKSPGVEV